MIIQIAEAHKALKEIKDAHNNVQHLYETKIRELEAIIEKKEKAIAELNASLFKMAQENIAKDEEIKWLKTPKVLPTEKPFNVEMLTPMFDMHADIVRQIEANKARQLESELIKLPKDFIMKGTIEWVKEPTEEKKLEVGKWYDARTFEVEELKRLLPVGTLVTVKTDGIIDEEVIHIDDSDTETSEVTEIEKEGNETVVYVKCYKHVSNNWFKIIEEIK